jgi:hypothetical protein
LIIADDAARAQLCSQAEQQKSEWSSFDFSASSLAVSGYKRSDQLKRTVDPILDITIPALSSPFLRSVITSGKNSINLAEIIKEKKLLLLRLPPAKETSPECNTDMLGSLIVAAARSHGWYFRTKSALLRAAGNYQAGRGEESRRIDSAVSLLPC